MRINKPPRGGLTRCVTDGSPDVARRARDAPQCLEQRAGSPEQKAKNRQQKRQEDQECLGIKPVWRGHQGFRRYLGRGFHGHGTTITHAMRELARRGLIAVKAMAAKNARVDA